jgi:hypothetical protein
VRFSLRNEDWSNKAKTTPWSFVAEAIGSVSCCDARRWSAFLNLGWNIKSLWSPGGQSLVALAQAFLSGAFEFGKRARLVS